MLLYDYFHIFSRIDLGKEKGGYLFGKFLFRAIQCSMKYKLMTWSVHCGLALLSVSTDHKKRKLYIRKRQRRWQREHHLKIMSFHFYQFIIRAKCALTTVLVCWNEIVISRLRFKQIIYHCCQVTPSIQLQNRLFQVIRDLKHRQRQRRRRRTGRRLVPSWSSSTCCRERENHHFTVQQRT